jgi:hypothetical protein
MTRAFVIAGLLLNVSILAAQSVSPVPRNPVIRDQTPDFNPTELASKSLKTVLIGDSLSVPFHYTNTFQARGMIHDHRQGGWFYDAEKDKATYSLYEQLADQKIPVSAMNLAIAGSWIKEPSYFTSARLFGMDSMDRQVSRILMEKEFPNLILIWQGHNDADWKYAADKSRIPENQWEASRKKLPERVTQNLKVQLARLLEKGRHVDYPVTIVVFGLLDARSALATRKIVLKKKYGADGKTENPVIYPRLADALEGFPSLVPKYEAETVAVFDDILRQWQDMVESLNQKIAKDQKPTQILYSDALSRLEITEAILSPEDGLHFKVPEGHQKAADAVMAELQRRNVLNYLHSTK